jgi:hypothetical protein
MKALGTLVYRAMGATVLDASMYEGIEADPAATGQALVIVLLASVAAGVGASGWAGPEWPVIVTFGVLALIGAFLIWPMLNSIDDRRPETVLPAFKANALIGAAILFAFAMEPIWRTVRPSIGG